MSRHFRTSEGHQKAFLCSSDRNTATSEPVKRMLAKRGSVVVLGSSGNCFLPSCRRIERDADSARYLSFLCVCASSFDHCANGLRGWGGGGFRNIPRADVPSSLVAVASNSNLLLLSSCFTDTRPGWTGIFCLTNRVFSVYHIPKPSWFSDCVYRQSQHNPMFLLKKASTYGGFFFFFCYHFQVLSDFEFIVNIDSKLNLWLNFLFIRINRNLLFQFFIFFFNFIIF